jgi:hypothetical protein
MSQLNVSARVATTFPELVLLGVGQWGLDCKVSVPALAEFKAEFCTRLRAATVDFLITFRMLPPPTNCQDASFHPCGESSIAHQKNAARTDAFQIRGFLPNWF